MNETEPSEKSATQAIAPASAPIPQQGRNIPPLAPMAPQATPQPTAQESATVEQLNHLVGKLQSMVSNSTQEAAYQVERNLMAQKIKDLLEDVSVCNENCEQYQQVIKLLAAKVKNLKIGNEKLQKENNMLQLKNLTSNKFELELAREKARTQTLLQKISGLKAKVTEFFTDQIESDQENVKIMKELREENTAYKKLLSKISQFRDTANLDKLCLSDEFKILNDDYRNFFKNPKI
jgi:DNA repair exonuclease SbcCD ATPase subunit